MSEVAVKESPIAFSNMLVGGVSLASILIEPTSNGNDMDWRKDVDAAKKDANMNDAQSVIFFGSKSQTGVTKISQQMLAGVKNKDVAPASNALNDIVAQIRGFNLDDLQNAKEPSFFGKLMGGVAPFVKAVQRYETVESQINVIVANLDRHVGILMKDVISLDKMAEEVKVSFRNLKVYIQAGEEILSELNDKVIPQLTSQLNDDPEKSMTLNSIQTFAQRMERRVHDLKLTRQAILQSLPMIRSIQDNDTNLIEKIQSTLVNSLGLWQQQIAMLLTAQNVNTAAMSVRAASDLTNELLVATADSMQKSNKIARVEIERGIFDIDAIKAANDSVVGTLMDSLEIYNQAHQARVEESKVLQECESKLLAALENIKKTA